MSERDLTPAVVAELDKDTMQLALFAELVFDTATVRLWTGIGPYVLDGETFTGAGDLVGVSSIKETSGDVSATGISMTLSFNRSLLAAVMQEHFQSRPATIWLVLFDLNWVIIPDKILLFKGKMDSPVFEKSGETARITISAESQLIDLDRPRVRRRTDADQQEMYPGDTGLRFVAGMQNHNVVWSSRN